MKPSHAVRVASRVCTILLLAWLCLLPPHTLHAQLSPEYQAAISYCSQGVTNQTLVLATDLLSLSQLNTNNAPAGVGAGWVEMSVFIKSSDRAYYNVGGFSTFGGSTLWTFSPQQFQSFFQNTNRFPTMLSGTNLILRIDQLLGLSDTSPNSYIADIWMDPATFLRPTRNPTLTNVTEDWTFPSPLIDVPGKSGADYYTWFTNRVGTVFAGTNAFPWTSLGYTYDWGTNGHLAGETPYEGLSEFLMFKGAGTYQYYTSGIYTPDQFVLLPEPGTTALVAVGAGWLLLAYRRCRCKSA
jgi:hypothetical protein